MHAHRSRFKALEAKVFHEYENKAFKPRGEAARIEKKEGKKAAEKYIAKATAGKVAREKGKAAHLVKGSKEAKEFMERLRKIREKRGKK